MPEVISTDDPNYPELHAPTPATTDNEGTGTPVDPPATSVDPAAGDGSGGVAEVTNPEVAEAATLNAESWDGTVTADGYVGQVVIDESISQELSAKGFNAKELAFELYTSEGGKLSDETKAKLDAAYGSFVVDAYLDSLAAKREMAFSKAREEDSTRKAAEADVHAWGEEVAQKESGLAWADFEAKALSALDDTQLQQFNDAMLSGNKFVQEYALKAVASMLKVPVEAGLPQPELGDTPASDSHTLSKSEYQTLLNKAQVDHVGDPAGYRNAVSQLDARRMAGIRSGI